MATLSLISATQQTPASGADTSYVDSGCETAATTLGQDYIVLFSASMSCGTAAQTVSMQLLHGATQIAEFTREGRGGGGASAGNGTHGGVRRITGDGNTVKFQVKSSVNSWNTDSQYILLIDVSDLTENTHFWYSGTNSGTNEGTDLDVADPPDNVLRTADFTLTNTGNHLAVFSAEMPLNTAAGNGVTWGAEIGGTDVDGHGDFRHEDENAADVFTFCWHTVQSLSAGSNTFRIVGGSVANAVADYRRTNMFVLDLTIFDQVVSTTDSTGDTWTEAAAGTYAGDFMPTEYTPNQEEAVIVLASYSGGNSANTRTTITKLENETDAVDLNLGTGCFSNNEGFDTDDDLSSIFNVAQETISAMKTYRIRRTASGNSGVHAIGRNRDNTGGTTSRLTVLSTEYTLLSINAGFLLVGSEM